MILEILTCITANSSSIGITIKIIFSIDSNESIISAAVGKGFCGNSDNIMFPIMVSFQRSR